MNLCKSCSKGGFANCYECVWDSEAEWAKIEAAEYQQKKKQNKYNKLINKIKKLFGGVEI